MSNLKNKLIRLGSENPRLRRHLRPILDVVTGRTATRSNDGVRETFLMVWDILLDETGENPSPGYERQVDMTGYHVVGKDIDPLSLERQIKSEISLSALAQNVSVQRVGEDPLGFPKYFVGIVEGDIDVAF